MPATWAGIDRNGECEAWRVWTEVGLAGKAASASAMNRCCRAGRMAVSWVGASARRGQGRGLDHRCDISVFDPDHEAPAVFSCPAQLRIARALLSELGFAG